MTGDARDFYIGYAERAPASMRPFLKVLVSVLVLLGIGTGVALVVSQPPYGPGVFEFLELRSFTGVLREHPVPHLEVPRGGTPVAGVPEDSRYLLVELGKVGAAARVAGMDGRHVRVHGTLIYADGRTMIELSEDPLELLADGDAGGPGEAGDPGNPGETVAESPRSLGRFTLIGEIVDSKCFLGVMKPGRLKTHKACAIRCIAGGIPPILVVQDGERIAHLVLVGADGEPVNDAVLELVAEPVRVDGEVERHGDLLVLRADPATIERL